MMRVVLDVVAVGLIVAGVILYSMPLGFVVGGVGLAVLNWVWQDRD